MHVGGREPHTWAGLLRRRYRRRERRPADHPLLSLPLSLPDSSVTIAIFNFNSSAPRPHAIPLLGFWLCTSSYSEGAARSEEECLHGMGVETQGISEFLQHFCPII